MTEDTEKKDDIEGMDYSEKSGWGEYPLDSVFVRKDQRTINEVVKRIEGKRYVLDPDFQRDFIWPLDKQSRLIESCLMRIPLPVFYVAEADDGRIIVVDGLQRLTTFFRYKTNQFALKGLGKDGDNKTQHPLEDMKFKDLPLKLQERIEDTQITLYILDEKAPERAKLDIFERVNGGVALTRQQMRNCLFNGQATRLLKELSDHDVFKTSTGNSLNRKTMRDREVINRFCAFKILSPDEYKGDMDDFLALALYKINELDEVAIEELQDEFIHSMRVSKFIFGKHAFRKSLVHQKDNVDRSVINVSLFDVISVLFADVTKEEAKRYKDNIRSAYVDLLKVDDFVDTITFSTNSVWRVKMRFEMAREALEDALQ